MLNQRASAQFRRDVRSCHKQQYDLTLLQAAIDILRIPAPLPPQYKDHKLTGNFSGYRECHIQPDWLLIYRVDGNELMLYRTGTHADLFGK